MRYASGYYELAAPQALSPEKRLEKDEFYDDFQDNVQMGRCP